MAFKTFLVVLIVAGLIAMSDAHDSKGQSKGKSKGKSKEISEENAQECGKINLIIVCSQNNQCIFMRITL